MKIKTLLKVVFLTSFVFLLFFINGVKKAEAVQAGGGPTAGGCQIVNFQLNPSLILSWELSPQCVSDTVSSPVTGTMTLFGGGVTVDGFYTQAITGLANVVAQTQSTTYTLTAYDSQNNSTSSSIVYNGTQHNGCIINSYSVTGSNNNYSITMNFPATGTGGLPCYIYANGTKVTNWNGSTFGYTVDASHSSELQLSAQDAGVGYTVAFISLPEYVAPPPSQTATLTVTQSPVSGGTWNITPGNLTTTPNTVTPSSGGTTYTLSCLTAPNNYGCPVSVTPITAFPGGSYNFAIIYPPTGQHNPPTVNAGSNQTINSPASSVTVSGTATYNAPPAGGTITSTSWTKIAGPSTYSITSPNSLATTITGLSTIGTYTFQLSATDNQGATGTGSMNVTVAAPNTPVVNITANPTSITAGSSSALTWSATNSPTSCLASGDWSGTQATSGTNVSTGVLNTVKTYQYGLSCTNGNGYGPVATASVVVNSGSLNGPDLIASGAGPSSATSGTPLNFTATIQNIGDTNTGASFSNFFQVSPDQSSTTDLASTSMSALGAGSSATATSPSYTFGPSGTYYVRACADKTSSAGGGVITESNETNNCSSWNTVTVGIANGGNLSITLSSQYSQVGYNQGTMLTWTIQNAFQCSTQSDTGNPDWAMYAGYGSAYSYVPGQDPHYTNGSHNKFISGIYSTTTFELDCYDQYWQPQSATVTVSVGTGVLPTATINASQTSVTSGGSTTVTWYAYNADQCIGQSDTGNAQWSQGWVYTGMDGTTPHAVNITNLTQTTKFQILCQNGWGQLTPWPSVTVTVIPPATPDLTADAPSPNSATSGTSLTFTSLIHNTGSASTGANFSNFFQVATASNGGGTTNDLASASMTTLGAGSSSIATSPSYTFNSAGTYSVRACADKTSSAGGGVITESNEGNNCSTWTDVTVTAPTPPPTVVLSADPLSISTGGTVTLTWSATGATICLGNGGSGTGAFNTNGATSGTVTVSPTSTTTYSVSCNNGNSSPGSDSKVVIVNGIPVKSPIFKEN